jgi:Skp family chaperone for outer membrane proteins
VFFLLLAGATCAWAQAPRTTTATPRTRAAVVVLDVGRVFKEHIRFKQRMELMKKDVTSFTDKINREKEDIKKLHEQRKLYEAGSPDYKKIEEDATRMQSQLVVEMQLKEREFMEQEAKLFYQTYMEVQQRVAEFADHNGISLVLRYNSEQIDPDDRASVLAGVNSPIVFQRDLDITSFIIEAVNRYSATDQRGVSPQVPQK